MVSSKNPGIVLMIVFLLILHKGQSQENGPINLVYISPVPGSQFVNPENNIALRQGDPFDLKTLSPSLLVVRNEIGERLKGSLKLSTDHKTLIYLPDSPFPLGQTIHVELQEGLKTINNTSIQPVEFKFTISSQITQTPCGNCENVNNSLLIDEHGSLQTAKDTMPKNIANDLPADFPNIIVTDYKDYKHGEYYFISHWNYGTTNGSYLIIMDDFGTPVYYCKGNATQRDFKLQHNGYLSFGSFDQLWGIVIMDSTYTAVDYFQPGNGYVNADFHEFQLLENGHAFISAVDCQEYAMDTVVPGGHPSALVCGYIVQELDPDKNVIFQWRSWDHYNITDTGPQIDLTAYYVDYVHGNAIEVESDTSILISSRSRDEITKIHRNTGEIIWHFGGKKNQFDVLNDPRGFNMQHDCRRLDNGNITLFDNGTMHPADPQHSRALEYALNEETFEAELVRHLRNDPDIFGNAMGNAQWRSDSTVIVGWGNGTPGITEFSLDGSMNQTIYFTGVSYRAFRFPWTTNHFLTGVDSLYFEIAAQDSLVQELEVINPNEFDIDITSIHHHSSSFSFPDELPVTVPAESSKTISIQFNPGALGIFDDRITLNSDINSDSVIQRIARQVNLSGIGIGGQGVEGNNISGVFASPNPVKNKLTLSFESIQKEVYIRVSNTMGRKMFDYSFKNRSSCVLDMHQLQTGIYFIEIYNGKSGNPETLKVVKE